ncbi:hypothetical protein BH10ACI1_BH10ACI1_00440 [soil metagenome]
MKNFRLIAVSLMFAAIFAVSVSAQTPAKIALINTAAFENETGGITKMVAARKALDNEFKTVLTDLQTLGTQITTLQADLKTLDTQIKAAQGAAQVPANLSALQASYAAKYDELDRKSREYKFKEDSAKASYERREAVVMGPVFQDIRKAVQEYGKSKGYTVVLDLANLFNSGNILYWEETINITDDFIKFYNARPATATTTTTTTK